MRLLAPDRAKGEWRWVDVEGLVSGSGLAFGDQGSNYSAFTLFHPRPEPYPHSRPHLHSLTLTLTLSLSHPHQSDEIGRARTSSRDSKDLVKKPGLPVEVEQKVEGEGAGEGEG